MVSVNLNSVADKPSQKAFIARNLNTQVRRLRRDHEGFILSLSRPCLILTSR